MIVHGINFVLLLSTTHKVQKICSNYEHCIKNKQRVNHFKGGQLSVLLFMYGYAVEGCF